MALDIFTDIDNETNPFELRFRNGDFVINNTPEQEIRLTLLSVKGNWKQSPLLGADVITFLHSSVRSNFRQIVATELEKIGYRLTEFNTGETLGDFDIGVEEII